MFSLIKNDIMTNDSNESSFIFMYLCFVPIAALFIEGDLIGLLVFYIPILMTVYKSIPMELENLSRKYDILLNSLPIKRWEYVTSKYISIIINYIIAILYILIILKILSFFRFNHLEYIRLADIKELLLVGLATFALILPISFIFSNKLRMFIIIVSITIIGQRYDNSEYGLIVGNLIEAIKGSSLIVIVLVYGISLGISIWFYNKKDLS